jgi:hypothetical protein
MVELPRNPLHYKIDALPSETRAILKDWPYQGSKPIQQPFHRILPYMQELLDQGLVAHTGGTTNDAGEQIVSHITPTFDGWQAIEHLRCGYYEHSNGIYATRAKRDAHDEQLPGWGQF